MAKVRFTAGRVRDFACPADKKQVFIWDTDAPGLGLRATAGASSYVFQARLVAGTPPIRMTIGATGTWNLDDARAEARRLHTLVDQGRDPRIVKAERIALDVATRQGMEQEAIPALDAWDAYILSRTPHWSDRHKRDHETMSREGGQAITRGRRPGMSAKKEPGILRPLLVLPIKGITREAVSVWLEGETSRRPTRARLAVSLLTAFLNWCADQPEYRAQVQDDACSRMKKDLPRANARDDCLQREQLALWFKQVRELHNPVQAAYLQALLLTGARRNELTGLRWEDVDFQWASMQIADKVEEQGRVIPLTPYVSYLLANLPRVNEWVFSSPRARSGRLQEPRIAHNRALADAGLPALSLHGLRRSFGTLAEWVEAPTGVVAQIMGHKPSAIAEKHYRRRPLDLLRMWHTRIENWILGQAGVSIPEQKTGAVTPFVRKAG